VVYREEEEEGAKKVGAADDAGHGLDMDRVRREPVLVGG
jgi:hypothetical protein